VDVYSGSTVFESQSGWRLLD